MRSDKIIRKEVKGFMTSQTYEEFVELNEHELSIIVLKVSANDYTLTQIAKLVEDNNAQIIRLEVIPSIDGLSLLISIKMNIIDISAVLRSFERFSYEVIYYYMKEGEINDTLEERLNELLHYLDM